MFNIENIFNYFKQLYNPTNKLERISAIYNTITSVLARDYTRADIISGYRNIGWGISNASFNEIFADFRLKPIGDEYFMSLGDTDLPDINQFSLTSRKFINDVNYRFVGMVDFSDPDTGDNVTLRMAVDLNDIKTMGEIRDALIQRLCDSDTRYCNSVNSIEIFAAYKH